MVCRPPKESDYAGPHSNACAFHVQWKIRFPQRVRAGGAYVPTLFVGMYVPLGSLFLDDSADMPKDGTSAPPLCVLAAGELGEGFDVVGLREQVKQLDGLQLVAAVGKKFEVASQGRRAAREVVNLARAQGCEEL